MRSAKKGAARGPSGMTSDHLRPLLDISKDTHLLFLVGELLARGRIPDPVRQVLGVRGIVAGEVIRRLTARTIAKQLGPEVKDAIVPFQYAFSTRSGCECVVHVLEALTESDPETTIPSIDVTSAYHTMLECLERVVGGSAVLPFVRLFYSSFSAYCWEDEDGEVHTIHQREGGDQHVASEAIQRGMSPDEKFWCSWTICTSFPSPREWDIAQCCTTRVVGPLQDPESWGKMYVWNRAGHKPEACNRLQRVAEVHDPTVRVWRGSEVLFAEQGIKVLGTLVGDEYVRSLLEKIQAKQQFLLNAIPTVPDVQSAWLLLLHCASARANYQFRVVRPELVNSFAESHDQGLWRCLCAIVGVPSETRDELTRATATLPLSLGGMGLRSVARTREAAYWASWADTLSMQTCLSGRVHGVPSRRRIVVAKFASCQSGSDRVGWDRRFHLASVVRFGGWITAREQRARRS